LHTVRDAFADDWVDPRYRAPLLGVVVGARRRSAIVEKGWMKDGCGGMKLAPVGRVPLVKGETWRIASPTA
jgi:hypothetical protein